jgi:hypothetical protein
VGAGSGDSRWSLRHAATAGARAVRPSGPALENRPIAADRLATAVRPTARAAALLTVAIALELLFRRVTSLPAGSYHEPSLILEVGRRLGSGDPAALLFTAGLLIAALMALARRSIGPAWNDFEHGPGLRWLVVITAFLLAWVHSTYAINLYFDRTHALDRILLIALVPLVWWRPIAVLPFVIVLLPIAGQFAHPIGGFSTASVGLLVRVLLYAGAFWMVRTVTDRIGSADLIFLICCLVAAHYWASGLGKLQIGWPLHDQVAYLLPATYASGWLAFMEPATIGRLTAAIAPWNIVLKAGTLLLELGALFALAHRHVLRSLLAGWVVMHAAIFAISGIWFWEWMVLDTALLVLLFGRGAPDWPIFRRPDFVLSLILIGGGALWFRPVALAWLDSPVSYAYRVEGIGASGRSYDLHPAFFSPYDYQFTLGDFHYLTRPPGLSITWGATQDLDALVALRSVRSAEELAAAEIAHGRTHFDQARSDQFDAFIRRFVGNWNARGGRRRGFGPAAPAKLWTFRRGAAPEADDPVTRVVVHQVTSLFDGRLYHEIRSRPVRTVDAIPVGVRPHNEAAASAAKRD